MAHLGNASLADSASLVSISVGDELKQLLLVVDCGSPLTLLLLLLVQLFELLLSMLFDKLGAVGTALLEVELVIKSALLVIDDDESGDAALLLLELMSAMALRMQLLM